MKKSLLLFGGVLSSSFVMFAQHTPVSQTVQNKNIVLEELTGIYCQYCPSGHEIANQISSSNPGRVVLVNIHAGSFSVPQAGDPDFRTTDGNALNTFFNPSGYPAGSVQRTPHSSDLNRIATGRGNWSSQVNALLSQQSPANVAMDATLNATTREVTVNVEIFYTTPQPAGTNHYLNIGILQNNVEGPQVNSGGWNPSAILPNGNYMHDHIFRGFINTGGTWGEQIDASQTGVITKTITYTLPASVGNVPLNLGQLEFFAILHEGNNTASNSKVITGAQVEPDLTNVPAATAGANGIVNLLTTCSGGSVTPVVKIENSGAPITSIDFSTTVAGGSPTLYTFNGNIPAFGSQEITLSSVPAAAGNCVVTITSVNGGAGTVGSVASSTKAVTISNIVANALSGSVNVTTDRYGAETTWKLFNSSNAVVAQGGPYTNATTNGAFPQPSVNVNLSANECYLLAVYDSYGDGFDSGYGDGKIELVVGGTVTANVTSFTTGKEKQSATKVSATASVNEVTAAIDMQVYPNPATETVNVKFEGKGGDYQINITDLSGRQVASTSVANATGAQLVAMPIEGLSAGNYLISVVKDGATFTQNLMIK